MCTDALARIIVIAMVLPASASKSWLVCVAAPGEARAILAGLDAPEPDLAGAPLWAPVHRTDRLEILVTGVGKANAAAALAHAFDAGRHAGVLSLGIAGALPGSGLDLRCVVAASRSFYADEGVLTPDGFTDLEAMGFPPGGDACAGMSVANDPSVADALERGGVPGLARSPIATVSTCSGTDAHARAVVERTGAVAEAMEGAALAFILRRLSPGTPFAEVRVISNTAGDRDAQRWDLAGALGRLREIVGLL